jgi:hypothetical protein
MYRRGRKNNLMRTLKAYLVPIIGLFLIIILFYSFFSWWNENSKNADIESVSSKTWINISYSLWETDASLILENWKEEKIEIWSVLAKWEKIKVKSWNVDLTLGDWNLLKLSKNGILEYKNNWVLYLDSANLWVEAKKPINISLKYWNVKINKNSIVNLNQNELESIVYDLSWVTEVQNLSWNSTILGEEKQLTISRQDASNTDLDLNNLKLDIEEYFKLWDWYTKNYNWVTLNDNKDTESLENSDLLDNLDTGSGDTLKSLNSYWKLTFYNLTDESYVTKWEINISWNYFDEDIAKISVNWNDIPLNTEVKTFELEKFKLSWKENDLVFKVFDDESNLIWKKVITIYSTVWKDQDIVNNKNTTNNKIENFPVRASNFLIYAPSNTWRFETNADVSIKWKVTNPDVKSVLVNWYRLKSYNGSTWRYHAFVAQGTLKAWTNNYTIKYLDKNGNIIYKQYYTIIKKLPEEKKELEKKNKEESDKKKRYYSWEIKL